MFRKHNDTARLLVEKGARVNVIDPLRHVPIILYPVIDRASIPACEDYLKNYPKGKYSAEVQETLEELYFRQATRLQTLEANQSYLKHFPNGKHSASVKSRLDYLS